ncbi:MAG: ATP-binding cassette domain-containing protein [Methylococcaceae bacterium]|nr:ATP-binding cassette domain-containing protein [Methylococcaceae bacterium]
MAYQFNNLQFYYADKLALSLDQVTIEQGKTTALIGANGSGKSTLLHLCAFLESPKQGELLFMEQPVNQSDLTPYRRRVGFLAQKPFMLRGTVFDNIDLALRIHGKKQRAEKIQRVLQQLDIEYCAEQQAKNLSGGELQKAALARLLVLEPEVLLLDEPFSYLDQSSAQSLELFLRHYTQETGQTLVFSTHDRLQGFALADQVLALAQGKRVHSPLINLFSGIVREHVFHSGAMRIILSESVVSGRHASINPQDIVLSADALVSSMRNCIQGRIVMIAEEGGSILVNVDTGVIFQVLITYQALQDLNIHLGDKIWVNFKSNSVVVF